MDWVNKLKAFEKEYENLQDLKIKKEKEAVEWARANRKIIKKDFPVAGRIYAISKLDEFIESTRYSFDINGGEYYYFKPTDTRFRPANDFGYSGFRVLVTGLVLDANLKPLPYQDMGTKMPVTCLSKISKSHSPRDKQKGITKVYVMIDKNTMYYKIGRSINPMYRESTLQSEKPTIELLETFDAIIRDEKVLHHKFKGKRIRGEWFDLSGSDLQFIRDYFNEKRKPSRQIKLVQG